ncbi:MAG: ferredoxin [Deltaproteobacteria bacterium HGW-Deltaproteobacteria-21]|jgi:adenylylsulfate reductase subunit B|nr:MAG: ferredoxin [Deltaproteobacteria bacterium HGW-Deltaproteobacteria-21]PKN66864.1 MAG: ferredoxin [Deltaproteobacteria bacterium HGW-Deltaproteobacteria-15]
MPPVINMEKCTGCGVCADICPTDVFCVTEKKKPPIIRYPEECWHCNSCVLDCKWAAIELRIPLPAMMLYVDAPAKAGQ